MWLMVLIMFDKIWHLICYLFILKSRCSIGTSYMWIFCILIFPFCSCSPSLSHYCCASDWSSSRVLLFILCSLVSVHMQQDDGILVWSYLRIVLGNLVGKILFIWDSDKFLKCLCLPCADWVSSPVGEETRVVFCLLDSVGFNALLGLSSPSDQ